jgi:hypothetical protein
MNQTEGFLLNCSGASLRVEAVRLETLVRQKRHSAISHSNPF